MLISWFSFLMMVLNTSVVAVPFVTSSATWCSVACLLVMRWRLSWVWSAVIVVVVSLV